MIDLVFTGKGVYLVSALTNRGQKWLDEHVMHDEAIVINGAIAIEGGAYAQQIADGAQRDGLTVELPS